MKILLTGAAGFIGSHTLLELLKSDHTAVALDSYVNSKPEAYERVKRLTGKDFPVYVQDLRDQFALDKLFQAHKFDAVIHFAGLKAVGESVQIPLSYYRNNLESTHVLLEVMASHGCKSLVFSSSSTVYGDPERLPVDETCRLQATNPYGRTKLFLEEILRDIANADSGWRIALLRYFNPVGAHESGDMGEDPKGIPNNLFPYVAQVAVGRLSELKVFGGDYPTPDGSGVRDYIHVVDLALGHVAAVENLHNMNGAEAINLGTGRGYSVLEVIHAFEEASGQKVPFKIVDRRPGDVASSYCSADKAVKWLQWKAERDLARMCVDAWRWQRKNPNGY